MSNDGTRKTVAAARGHETGRLAALEYLPADRTGGVSEASQTGRPGDRLDGVPDLSVRGKPHHGGAVTYAPTNRKPPHPGSRPDSSRRLPPERRKVEVSREKRGGQYVAP